MKSSQRWFHDLSQQATLPRVASVPVTVKSGPNNQQPSDAQKKDKNGKKYFIVGESKIGEEDVVG